MTRDEFMELVYETFADEPDNMLANGIIEAADAYVEHEKAQLSCEGTTKGATSDTISRQVAIDAAKDWYEGLICGSVNGLIKRLNALPSVQPEPQWIPVERELPEESGWHICTCHDGVSERVTFLKWQKRLEQWEKTGTRSYWKVIAWMPLPAPYQKGAKD